MRVGGQCCAASEYVNSSAEAATPTSLANRSRRYEDMYHICPPARTSAPGGLEPDAKGDQQLSFLTIDI